jgi:hypothetical protein
MRRFNKFLDEKLGGSTDARFGIIGLLAGFVLFAIPLEIYFFDKGGWINMGSTAANIVGIVVGVMWLVALALAVYAAVRWAKSPNISNTPTELKAIKKELRRIRKILDGGARK